jgi:hypothetical protein
LAALIIGVLVVPATAAGASKPPTHLVCGQTITSDVWLRHDMVCPQGFDVPQGASVTIDLGGHRLTTDGLRSDGATLRLVHGTLDGSITTAPAVGGTVLIIEHVHVVGHIANNSGFGAMDLVEWSRVDGTYTSFSQAVTFDHDLLGGVTIDDALLNVHLSINQNLILDSPADGVYFNDEFIQPDVTGQVTDNLVVGSVGSGLLSDGEDLDHLLVQDNKFFRNGGDGIAILASPDAFGAGSATIQGNLALLNRGHGINVTAPGAFADGGGNLAILNGLDPQCVGITCGPGHG